MKFDGLPMLTFLWLDRGDCVFNAEGGYKTLAPGIRNGEQPHLVRTRLVPESTLERWVQERKAIRK